MIKRKKRVKKMRVEKTMENSHLTSYALVVVLATQAVAMMRMLIRRAWRLVYL